jgi:cytochrome P450
VKAGSELVIPQWAVHRSPRYYKEPNCFRPERWTPDFIAGLPHFAYFPFGGGPRTCIGNTFGMAESMFVISRMLSRYEFATTSNTDAALHLGVTLLPREDSLKLKVTRKSSSPSSSLSPSESTSGCPFHRAAPKVS